MFQSQVVVSIRLRGRVRRTWVDGVCAVWVVLGRANFSVDRHERDFVYRWSDCDRDGVCGIV